MSDVVVYNNGELELKISVNEETLWLTQKQLAKLFDVTKQNISLHVNNIFKEKELDKNSTVKFFLIVQKVVRVVSSMQSIYDEAKEGTKKVGFV